MTKIIALEEHFITSDFESSSDANVSESQGLNNMFSSGFLEIIKHLEDLGDLRLADMEAGGIDKQIMSLTATVGDTPDEITAEVARRTNDTLAAAIEAYPNHFGGFATLPNTSVEEAVAELERAVTKLHLSGANINGIGQGAYLDDPKFRPLLAKAEALDVPLYIHPGIPPKAVVDTYYRGNFSEQVTGTLRAGGFGWHIDAAVQLIRMIVSGVFDEFPDLKIISGHLGEGLMWAVQRLDQTLPQSETKLAHPVSYYIQNNLYFTISGYRSEPQFMELYQQIGADHIMFSVDYPYDNHIKETREFVETLPIAPSEKEKIFHENAEKLLKL